MILDFFVLSKAIYCKIVVILVFVDNAVFWAIVSISPDRKGRAIHVSKKQKPLRDFVYRVVSMCIYKLISSVGICTLDLDLNS